jgi:hypothetical protein
MDNTAAKFCYHCGKPLLDGVCAACAAVPAPVAAAPQSIPAPVAVPPAAPAKSEWRKYMAAAAVAGAMVWKYKFALLLMLRTYVHLSPR